MYDDAPAALPPDRTGRICLYVALAIIPVNTGVCLAALGDRRWRDTLFLIFTLLALAQLVLGFVAAVTGFQVRRARGQGGLVRILVGFLVAAGAPLGWLAGLIGTALGHGLVGGAWGRPLRVRGRQLHPSLREGADWTAGDRPDPGDLDPATRRALEALWLHDAQKEHASVPAFSRISWLLAAVGARADLIRWAHRAALEEIEHTQACFALAAGYGGRSHTVEPLPELLLGESVRDPLVTLAVESLGDGCQLEDFNADVAAECAAVCQEPVTRAVLERIAREERSHADFSWALLRWLLERDPDRTRAAVREALSRLAAYPRPTAVSAEKRALVDAADPALLRRHGRLPDARWAELWDQRLRATRERVRSLLEARAAARAGDFSAGVQPHL